MNIFSTRPALRWGVPVAAAAMVVGGGAALRTVSASGAENLPERSAQQLLVDIQSAQVEGLSGTVVEHADLGLPQLPISGAGGGSGSSQLSSMLSGTHTMRVWTAGSDQVRLSLLGTAGESDVIRNGRDLWTWSSADQAATHVMLPAAGEARAARAMPSRTGPALTPQQAAAQLLKAVNPSTEVRPDGTAMVAGRTAYELVVTPRDKGSLVASVRVAIDGATHVPLRVQAYSTKASKPALEVGFTSVSFGKPDAGQFAFNPPPGTKLTRQSLPPLSSLMPGMPGARLDQAAAKGSTPQLVGSGWTTVVKAAVPAQLLAGPAKAGHDSGHGRAPSAATFLSSLPRVQGSWGSGRLLSGTLLTALLTDSGTLYAGAVTPQVLYAAAAR